MVIAYGKAGLLEKARALGEEILREHDVAELHSLLGELYSEKGDSRSAAKQYQAAAQLDPSEDNVFDFGSSLLKFEDDSALRVFRFGTEKYPDSEKMHLGLASALYGQGLIDQGVTEAYKASELNPADPEAMGLLGQMAHIPAGMSAAIIDGFSALSKLYPRNGRLTYYYAMALSGRWSDEPAADSARVVELLKKATELDQILQRRIFNWECFIRNKMGSGCTSLLSGGGKTRPRAGELSLPPRACLQEMRICDRLSPRDANL